MSIGTISSTHVLRRSIEFQLYIFCRRGNLIEGPSKILQCACVLALNMRTWVSPHSVTMDERTTKLCTVCRRYSVLGVVVVTVLPGTLRTYTFVRYITYNQDNYVLHRNLVQMHCRRSSGTTPAYNSYSVS